MIRKTALHLGLLLLVSTMQAQDFETATMARKAIRASTALR